MTLPDLQARLVRLGVTLSLRRVAGEPPKLKVDAPVGVLTEELVAALTTHKPRLLALLDGVGDRTEPTAPPVSEPLRPAGATDRGPAPSDHRRRWEADSAGRSALTDSEAVAAIDRAFGGGDLAPAGPSERGPRDVRHGDRWLPWHFVADGAAPLLEPADQYDEEERAAIREHGGG